MKIGRSRQTDVVLSTDRYWHTTSRTTEGIAVAYAKLRGNGSEIRFSVDKVKAIFSAERAPELRCVEECVVQ